MLSNNADPYYVAKDEVEQAKKKLLQMHDEWKHLLQSENTAKSTRFQHIHAEILGELQQLEFDLKDISATISMVEEHRAKFQFDDQEVASRKEFVRSTNDTIKEIGDSLKSRQTADKLDRDKRALASSQATASKAANDRQVRIREENQSFLNEHRQEQAQIMQQQDEALHELSKSTQRLGETARTINRELQDQQQMLEQLDEDIEKETEKLNFVMKRMGRLLKTSDNKMLCTIIFLVILFLFLLFLLIS